MEKLKYKSAFVGPKIKRKQTWLFGLQIGATLFQIGVGRDENGVSYSYIRVRTSVRRFLMDKAVMRVHEDCK